MTTAVAMALVSMATILSVFVVPLTSQKSSSASTSGGSGGKTNSAAVMRQLTKVFGIERVPDVPRPRRQRAPPEYMKELYEMVAYQDGISKFSSPYDADIVRGIPDKASVQQSYYFFNISHVGRSESVLEAEFHLFKLRPSTPSSTSSVTSSSPSAALPGNDRRRRRTTRDVHVIDLLLYEVLRPTTEDDVTDDVIDDVNLRLLHRRRISGHYRPGWEVFNVSATVRRWMEDPRSNNGFLVRILSPEGQRVNGTHLRFAQRMEHHDSKQPVLIVFTDDKTRHVTTSNDLMEDEAYKPPSSDSDLRTMRQTYIRFLNEGYRAQHGPFKRPHAYMSPAVHQRLVNGTTAVRPRRSPDPYARVGPGGSYTRRRKRTCQRQEMYVDFEKIGWSGWIISPKGYNAYHCKGVCPFPLGQNQRPTNHATVQSIVYALKIVPDVETPCCVPNKLYSISLLYFDDDENVILKQYDEMVAASCGCH